MNGGFAIEPIDVVYFINSLLIKKKLNSRAAKKRRREKRRRKVFGRRVGKQNEYTVAVQGQSAILT